MTSIMIMTKLNGYLNVWIQFQETVNGFVRSTVRS